MYVLLPESSMAFSGTVEWGTRNKDCLSILKLLFCGFRKDIPYILWGFTLIRMTEWFWYRLEIGGTFCRRCDFKSYQVLSCFNFIPLVRIFKVEIKQKYVIESLKKRIIRPPSVSDWGEGQRAVALEILNENDVKLFSCSY